MKVLCICRQGRERSRHLAEYLAKRGYTTKYRGIDPIGGNLVKWEDVAWADVVITMRKPIKDDLFHLVDMKKKRVVELEVPGYPDSYGPDAVALEAIAPHEFKTLYVYPFIEQQIEKHLPL